MRTPNLIIPIVITTLMFSYIAESQAEIGIGSTRKEVIDTYGLPSGQLKSGDEEILTYPGGLLTIRNDKVISIDDDFVQRLESRKKTNAFESEQKAKGLILHNGKWITKAEKQSQERSQAEEEIKQRLTNDPILVFSNQGQAIDINALLVSGKITIIDFYADWCGPCKSISPHLEQIARNDPEVFLRKVDIVTWQTPVVQQYAIKSVPNIRVFNRRGKMIGQPTHNINQVQEYIEKAK
ncbi:MAG: thioredoxin family protein [PVC group bacterium]|nr:thioredoxin family protein [PVC group bacterium]